MKRFDVYLVELDPVRGSEIKKTRPCVILSPYEMVSLRTVIVAPLTSLGHAAPFRVDTTFQGVKGRLLLDQIRTVDKSRLTKHLGHLHAASGRRALAILREMFAE